MALNMSQAVVEAYANSHNSTRQTLYTEGLNVLQNNYPTGVIHYPLFDILKYRISRARSLNTSPIPNTYAAIPKLGSFRHN